jgi:hypothetical protein
MASIEQIKGVFNKGPAFPNRYRVIIPGFREGDLLCDAVNLPGKQITTNPRTIGMVTQELPYAFVVDPVTLIFYLDAAYSARNYFDAWQQKIIGTDTYEVAFKETFVEDLVIQQLDKEDESVIYSVKLLDAFPKTVNGTDLGNEQANTIARLSVEIQYTDFDIL